MVILRGDSMKEVVICQTKKNLLQFFIAAGFLFTVLINLRHELQQPVLVH